MWSCDVASLSLLCSVCVADTGGYLDRAASHSNHTRSHPLNSLHPKPTPVTLYSTPVHSDTTFVSSRRRSTTTHLTPSIITSRRVPNGLQPIRNHSSSGPALPHSKGHTSVPASVPVCHVNNPHSLAGPEHVSSLPTTAQNRISGNSCSLSSQAPPPPPLPLPHHHQFQSLSSVTTVTANHQSKWLETM